MMEALAKVVSEAVAFREVAPAEDPEAAFRAEGLAEDLAADSQAEGLAEDGMEEVPAGVVLIGAAAD
ncbi:hypothetical protein, partial [Asaia prunellae]|uniref:hypothetical protein n=1 Tax=Asaia prunellae TaxID=610245 RepID=UPI00131F23EB